MPYISLSNASSLCVAHLFIAAVSLASCGKLNNPSLSPSSTTVPLNPVQPSESARQPPISGTAANQSPASAATATVDGLESQKPLSPAAFPITLDPNTMTGPLSQQPERRAPPSLQGNGNSILVSDSNSFSTVCLSVLGTEHGYNYAFLFVQDGNLGSFTPVRQGMMFFQTNISVAGRENKLAEDSNVLFWAGTIQATGGLVRYPPDTPNCELVSGDAALPGVLHYKNPNADWNTFEGTEISADIKFPGGDGFLAQTLHFSGEPTCSINFFQTAMMAPQEYACVP